MRTNRLFAVVALASVSACIAIASAQPERPAGAGPRQPGGRPGAEPPSVDASMKGMNRALSQLRDQIADTTRKEACLKLIGDAQRGCINAKSGMPHQIDEMKDAIAKAKAAESFRRKLMAVARKLLDIEQNILEGNNDAAKTLVAEVLTMRDEAHTEFGVE